MSLNIEALEQSFAQIEPDAAEFSSSFYSNLLTDYPQVRPLFNTTDMERQQKKLISSLVLVIENLQNPTVLSDALKGLGAKHIKYGTLPEHYPMVGRTLLKTFESFLEKDWTPEVKLAWTDAYEAITSLMLEGASYSKEALRLEMEDP